MKVDNVSVLNSKMANANMQHNRRKRKGGASHAMRGPMQLVLMGLLSRCLYCPIVVPSGDSGSHVLAPLATLDLMVPLPQ